REPCLLGYVVPTAVADVDLDRIEPTRVHWALLHHDRPARLLLLNVDVVVALADTAFERVDLGHHASPPSTGSIPYTRQNCVKLGRLSPFGFHRTTSGSYPGPLQKCIGHAE